MDPRLVAATTITAERVVNRDDEDLGLIKDVMIDLRTGKVAYVVLSFGGLLGLGDKLFAVPWTALCRDHEDNRWILDVPREKLEQAPGFDKNQWPSVTDLAWAAEIDAFYGAPADEAEGAATTDTGEAPRPRGAPDA